MPKTFGYLLSMKRPKDKQCDLAIREVVERVPLEGGFLPRRYKVIVNDFEKEFEIQGVAANVDQKNGRVHLSVGGVLQRE